MPYTELIIDNSITESRLVKDYILTFNLINKIEIFYASTNFSVYHIFHHSQNQLFTSVREYINGPYN